MDWVYPKSELNSVSAKSPPVITNVVASNCSSDRWLKKHEVNGTKLVIAACEQCWRNMFYLN